MGNSVIMKQFLKRYPALAFMFAWTLVAHSSIWWFKPDPNDFDPVGLGTPADEILMIWVISVAAYLFLHFLFWFARLIVAQLNRTVE